MTRQNYKVMDGHIGNYICRGPKRHEGKARPSRVTAFDGGIGSIKFSQLTARSVGDFRNQLRDAGVTAPSPFWTATHPIMASSCPTFQIPVSSMIVQCGSISAVQLHREYARYIAAL